MLSAAWTDDIAERNARAVIRQTFFIFSPFAERSALSDGYGGFTEGGKPE
jgi:hypothetical protein